MRSRFLFVVCPSLFVIVTAILIALSCSDKSSGPRETAIPRILSLSPERGPAGSRIAVTGENFGNSVKSILFDSLAGYVDLWTDTMIVADIPAQLKKPCDIVVAVNGKSSPPARFIVENLFIDSIIPPEALPGTEVFIHGKEFGSIPGIVMFDTVEAEMLEWSGTLIRVRVPEIANSCNIEIRAQDMHSNIFGFGITQMMIIRLSPDEGIPGANIAVYGRNFGNTPGNVSFDGIYGEIVSWDDTLIVAIVPDNVANGNLIVEFGGAQSNPLPFQARQLSISHLEPDSVLVDETINIIGSFYGAIDPVVLFNDMPVNPEYSANTVITARVPTEITGGNVAVQIFGRQSNAMPFKILHAAIESIDPDSAVIGQQVNIRGRHFRKTAGRVFFDDIEAEETSWSNSLITAKIPTGAVPGQVRIQNQYEYSNFYDYYVELNPNIGDLLHLTNSVEVIFHGFGRYENCHSDRFTPRSCTTTDGGYVYKKVSNTDWYNQQIEWIGDSINLYYHTDPYGYDESWAVDMKIFGKISESGDSLLYISATFNLMYLYSVDMNRWGTTVILQNLPFSSYYGLDSGIVFYSSGSDAYDKYVGVAHNSYSMDAMPDMEEHSSHLFGVDIRHPDYPPELTVIFRRR